MSNIMNKNESLGDFCSVIDRAMTFCKKARREGQLSLEEDLDSEKVANRNIFEYGMCFVVDGYEDVFIDKILSNIINQEKDNAVRTLKTMQKEAVLSIQNGDSPYKLLTLLNSYTDIPLSDPKMRQFID